MIKPLMTSFFLTLSSQAHALTAILPHLGVGYNTVEQGHLALGIRALLPTVYGVGAGLVRAEFGNEKAGLTLGAVSLTKYAPFLSVRSSIYTDESTSYQIGYDGLGFAAHVGWLTKGKQHSLYSGIEISVF